MRLPPAPGGGDQVVFGTDNAANQAIFSASNNVTFGYNTANSVVTASASFAQTNQQVTLYGAGNTTQGSSGTQNASSVLFRGAGIASVGMSNGSVVVSAVQSTQTFLGGVSVDGSAAITAGSIVLSNSPTVTFGLAGSTVTASAAGGGAAAPNMSVWQPAPIGTAGGAVMYSITRPAFTPLNAGGPMPGAMTWETLGMLVSGQSNTSSIPAHTISVSLGLYKLTNATQLTLVNSVLWTTGTNASVDSGYLSSYAKQRHLTIASSQWSAVPAVSAGGSYWLGIMVSTAGSSINAAFVGQLFPYRPDNYAGDFGGATSKTNAVQFPFMGLYSNSSASLPASVGSAEIVGSNVFSDLGNAMVYNMFAVQSISWRT